VIRECFYSVVVKRLPTINYEKSARTNENATCLALYLATGLRLHKTRQISLTEIVDALRSVRYGGGQAEYAKDSTRL